MATFYKDFNKEVKDLLTKNYQKVGTWQVECKGKGADRQLFVNPQANDSGVSVDVEWNCKDCGIKTKTRLDSKGNVKPKVTYEQNGHKVEVSSDKALNYELVHETKIGKIALNEKLNKKNFEAAATTAVAPHCFVGAGVVYGISSGKLNWSAGMRYNHSGRIVDILTNDLNKFTTGLHTPVEVAGKKVNVAFQADCTRGGGFSGRAGIETPCLVCKVSTLKFNIDNKLNCNISYISKLANGWKSIISADCSGKFGVLFQNE